MSVYMGNEGERECLLACVRKWEGEEREGLGEGGFGRREKYLRLAIIIRIQRPSFSTMIHASLDTT